MTPEVFQSATWSTDVRCCCSESSFAECLICEFVPLTDLRGRVQTSDLRLFLWHLQNNSRKSGVDPHVFIRADY